MSTYAVFGMTRHRAIELARKAVDALERQKRKQFGEPAYTAKVKEEADYIMQSPRTVQLSDKFDAPQFAREFLELARKSESRSLHIRAYAETGELHPKTRKPIMAWHDCNAIGEVVL